MSKSKDENDRLAEGSLPGDPADDVEPVARENHARAEGRRLAGSTKGQPSDVDAEVALLASILWAAKYGHATIMVSTVRDLLESGDRFFSKSHQLIYDAMLSIDDAKSLPTPVAVQSRLREHGSDRAAGGVEYLEKLVSDAAATSEIIARAYAQSIRDTWMLRQMIAIGERIARDARAAKATAASVLETAHALVSEVAKSASATAEDEKLNHVMKRVVSNALSTAKRGGIHTGFRAIDKAIPALLPKEVTIVAARTSVGKSMWATQVSLNVVIDDPELAVEYVSLEMRSELFVERLLSSLSGVSHKVFRATEAGVQINEEGTVGFTKDQFAKVLDAVNKWGGAPIFFSKSQTQTLLSINAIASKRAATLQKEGKRLALIVVDHIGLVKPSGPRKRERRDEVAETSRGLRWLAETNNCHVIGISQINREVEKGRGGDRIPKLHNLKDSGSVEDDADNVFILHREKDENDMFVPNKPVIFNVAKGRNDGRHSLKLGIDAEFMRFTDWDEESDRPFSEGETG
jgi:replicative DNA helicase